VSLIRRQRIERLLTRQQRIDRLAATYPQPTDWLEIAEDHPSDRRYALVSQSPSAGEYWISTHSSRDGAAERADRDSDDGGWAPHLLVDLDTGDQWDPVVRTQWQGRATTQDEDASTADTEPAPAPPLEGA
jgi:hypothetical protein